MHGRERAGRGRRILVVEADASMRQVITQPLEEAGFAVQTVRSASEALAVLGHQPPRAMLVDLTQPGAEGWAFLERCRQQPRCRRLPIAVVSTSVAQDSAGPGQGQHYGWLPKPFERDQLLTLMDDLTRLRPSRHAEGRA